MKRILAFALFLSPLSAAQEKFSWHSKETPHFKVFHESRRLDPGFIYKLEAIYSRMNLHLGHFSPWMTKDKTKIYLYKNSKSYFSGQFQPPTWSQGIAELNSRSVALYEQKNAKNTEQTLAHELTHLFFEDFFQKGKMSAPKWLTEGLAMMMEEEKIEKSEDGLRVAAMKAAAKEAKPIAAIFLQEPDVHGSSVETSQWYMRSYSLVRFLYTHYPRLQFKTFCTQIREGRTLEKAFWLSYRFRSFKDLDKAWLDWIRHSSKEKPFSL